MLELQEVFQDKYKMVKVLGQGGMGKVYLAKHITLGTSWAIKEIKKGNNIDLLAEPSMLKRLNNPNIPRIIDIFEDDEHLYIVEDFIEGKPLKEIIEEKKIIEENQVIKWALELCDILIYLHSFKPNPIIYRDLKPENIMISSDNKVKLIDFGIAREYKSYKTEDTQNLGSIGYADYELLVKGGQSDERTDIFSLGVTMHQMLTGVDPRQYPYENELVRKFNNKLSPGIEKIVANCTDKKRDNRFKSALELRSALENIEYINSKEYKIARRKRIRIAVFCVVVFICIGIITAAFKLENNNKEFNKSIAKGNSYLEQMEYKDAESEVVKALKIDSNNIKAYELLCSIYNTQGDYDNLLKTVDKVKEKNIQFTDRIYVYYAGAIFEKGNFKSAREYYEKAIEINNSNIEAKAGIAVSYAKENNYNKAMEILEEIKNDGGNKFFVAFTEGEILYSSGEASKAEESFKAALAQRPQDLKVLMRLSEVLYKEKKYLEAIETLDKANTITENNLRILDKLGACNFNLAINQSNEVDKNKYLNKSLFYYQQKEKLGDKSSDNLVSMGIVQEALGNNDEAIRLFTQETELNAKDTLALRHLGILYGNKKDYNKSKEYFNKILAITNSGEDYDYAKEQIKMITANGW